MAIPNRLIITTVSPATTSPTHIAAYSPIRVRNVGSDSPNTATASSAPTAPKCTGPVRNRHTHTRACGVTPSAHRVSEASAPARIPSGTTPGRVRPRERAGEDRGEEQERRRPPGEFEPEGATDRLVAAQDALVAHGQQHRGERGGDHERQHRRSAGGDLVGVERVEAGG